VVRGVASPAITAVARSRAAAHAATTTATRAASILHPCAAPIEREVRQHAVLITHLHFATGGGSIRRPPDTGRRVESQQGPPARRRTGVAIRMIAAATGADSRVRCGRVAGQAGDHVGGLDAAL